MLAGHHPLAARQHDVGRAQVVDRQAELAREPAEASAKRQPRDPRGRVDADRCRETVRLSRAVELAERDAGLHARRPSRRVHVDSLHGRQVDHEAIVDQGASRDVVPAAADRHDEIVLAREIHGRRHVPGVPAAHDDRRMAVDHSVPDGARVIVSR